MALSEQMNPATPILGDGRPLPLLFCTLANGNLKASSHADTIRRMNLVPRRDNGWPRSIVFFNMGTPIHPKDMRRGDVVGIHWMPKNGGPPIGHATFCWDVHLNQQGEVDAFLYLSSNGSMGEGRTGRGKGVSVGGTPNTMIR